MILIFSIILYPFFMILLYAISEYYLPTKNSAMLFSMAGAIILCYLYYVIRTKLHRKSQLKKTERESKANTITQLMLINETSFSDAFKKENTICDNSFEGIDEEKILKYMRENGIKSKLEIYSLNGITPGCKDLLKLLKTQYTLHTQDEIIEQTKEIKLPEIETDSKTSKLKHFITAVTSKPFEQFALKYGIILLILSIISAYKLYYILSGVVLISYSIFLKIRKRINQQNQIPYLRS